MTLSKQLLLLISTIFLAIFAVNFYTSLTNIRDYLQVESEVHAQDTATSLGLSLSPYILNEQDTIIETMVNSIFDRGYYLEIRLDDAEDKEVLRKTNPKTFTEVPVWFTELLPMETVTAASEIDAGWVSGGTIYVTIHPGLGYLKLWQQAQETLLVSLLMFLLFIILLVLILMLVLRPLSRIERLALSIADGNFATIKKLPWTTEIRNVARSMNLMSGKIEQVISNLNKKLEETSKQLRVDELTGLEMRATFETQMKERFMSKGDGFLFILRIDELGAFAKSSGRQKVDEFIKGFVAEIEAEITDSNMQGSEIFRIVGAEFILITSCPSQSAAETFCQRLLKRLSLLGERYQRSSVAHIGGVIFDPQGSTASLVASATEAYEKARLIGANSYAINQESGNAHSADEWKEIVTSIIEHAQVELTYGVQTYALNEEAQGKLLMEEAISTVADSNGTVLPIGTFISVAETIGLICRFDKLIINKVIRHIQDQQITHPIAINLSYASLVDPEFRSELTDILEQHQSIAPQLVFSITAYSAAKNMDVFASFIRMVHQLGAKVMLKRFETRFIPMDQLKQFNLDYIRLARIYTENISSDIQKRHLVEAMRELGELLAVSIHAESVVSDEDYKVVAEIGLDATSR